MIDETKIPSTGFITFSNHDTLNIPNIFNLNAILGLVSQTKCDDMFSDSDSDHIYSHFLVTYVVSILFILVRGNCPLTFKSGRCRNLPPIDSRLNRINPVTNIIFVPNAERGYIIKFEILLGGVFQYSIE